MKKVGNIQRLDVQATRRVMTSNLRYCLQGDTLYLPGNPSLVDSRHRLCWGRIRIEELDELPWLAAFDQELPEDPLEYHKPFTGIGFGVMYSRRHRETPEGRVPVAAFVAQSLIDRIAENPDALLNVSKADFEALVAELFARRGFEVGLVSRDQGRRD